MLNGMLKNGILNGTLICCTVNVQEFSNVTSKSVKHILCDVADDSVLKSLAHKVIICEEYQEYLIKNRYQPSSHAITCKTHDRKSLKVVL